MAETPVTVIRRQPTFTELRWSTPLAGNDDANVFQFAVLAGVMHIFPNADDPTEDSARNPNAFVMVDRLWPFFKKHPRPN